MRIPSYKLTYFYLFISCCLILAGAGYIQHVYYLQPCLLCMIQRIILFILTFICLGATLHNHNIISKKVYNISALSMTILGLIVSGRQIWLQSFAKASDKTYCIPDYSYLDLSIWKQLLKAFSSTSTSCADISWKFLHISMAGWSFIFFLIFAIVIFYQCRR